MWNHGSLFAGMYIYGFTHQRLCCMFVLGYTVLSWCNFSSTGVLNLMYLWTLLFGHSNIFMDSSAIGYCVNNCRKIRGYMFWVSEVKGQISKITTFLFTLMFCACFLAFQWCIDCFSSFINSGVIRINVVVSMRFGSKFRFFLDILAWTNNCTKFHKNWSRVMFWVIDLTWNDP